jgi:hypothetical protein
MSIIENLTSKFEEHQLEQINNSWCLANKSERKHRLKTIIALVLELEEIKKVDKFATTFGDMAIEAVICGDWKEFEQVCEYQTFKDESIEIQKRYAPLWEKFRTIAETAIAEERVRNTSEIH